MSDVLGLEVVKVETLSPPHSTAINELMKQSQQQQPPTTLPEMQHQAERANAEQLFSDSSMNGDNMQITYNFSTRKRGLSWSDMETRALLEVWTERNNLFEADDLCSVNGQIYRTIANEMAERGYQKTAIQCKTRMKTLKRAYKHCRMLLRTRGKVKKFCRFYKEIDYIIRNTESKKKLVQKSGPLLDADGKQAVNGSWDSSKSSATDSEKFDQLAMPLMECEVIENELSDEIEISDDDDNEEIDEEEENISASTPEMKTSQPAVPISSVSIASESKPVETKLEAFSLNPVESKWLNVISLDDSANASNANHLSNNRNLLLELGEIAKPNSQNQVANTRPPFSFSESGIFLSEKESISHLNSGSKPFSNKQTMNQLDINNDQPLEALSEPVAKELWANNMQGVRNILQKQGITQFSQPNENRLINSSSSTFQTNKHFQPPLDIIQINQPVLDKSLDARTLTSSSSSYNDAAALTPVMPMEILVPGNEPRTETDDHRKRRQTAETNYFEQTLRSVVDSFTNTLEQIQNKQLQAETLRLDLEMKKLEVERERQVLEREKMKNEVQRHREDREHQFAMLKMILEHVSSPRPSLAAENIGLDSSTSQLLNSIKPKTWSLWRFNFFFFFFCFQSKINILDLKVVNKKEGIFIFLCVCKMLVFVLLGFFRGGFWEYFSRSALNK